MVYGIILGSSANLYPSPNVIATYLCCHGLHSNHIVFRGSCIGDVSLQYPTSTTAVKIFFDSINFSPALNMELICPKTTTFAVSFYLRILPSASDCRRLKVDVPKVNEYGR